MKSKTDRFGHPLDQNVGYARGRILASSVEESLRVANAQRLLRARRASHGPDSIAIFTGNQRTYPLLQGELARMADEWTGPAEFGPVLGRRILEHLGGGIDHAYAVFNRTSAGIVATIASITHEGLVISYAAPPGRAHPSVFRGARVAFREMAEVTTLDELGDLIRRAAVALLVLTSMTSELESLTPYQIEQACALAHERNIPVLLDDAYGARLRPVAMGGPLALNTGADVVITNSDKAGLVGPRAGFMAGAAEYVQRAYATAEEFGLEARAPIALGVMRALEIYDPTVLKGELQVATTLNDELERLLGAEHVVRTLLGPVVGPDEVLIVAAARAQIPPGDTKVVPCEASTALGMLLLRDEGVLTVNAAGSPGARVSLRLKTTPGALERVGGVKAIVNAVDRCLWRLAEMITDEDAIRALILGPA